MTTKLEQEKKRSFDDQIQYLRGVGPQRSRILERLGISTLEDLLYCFPRRYEDRTQRRRLAEAPLGERCLAGGKVTGIRAFRIRGGRKILNVIFSDGRNDCKAVWFNAAYLEKTFKAGDTAEFYGTFEKKGGSYQIVHPEFEITSGENVRRVHTGRIVPFYSLTKDLSQLVMRNLEYQLLLDILKLVEDPLPPEDRTILGLQNRRFALKEIHFPSTRDALRAAYRRLVFDEFFAIQLMLALKKKRREQIHQISEADGERIGDAELRAFYALLDYEPTEQQDIAAREILKDLNLGRPMRRLLQGDVGSGKTTIAAWCLYAMAVSGKQGALMAPTEILAQQHYLTLSRLFAPAGLTVGLLTQGQSPDEKARVIRRLVSGDLSVVVGTHALIQDKVKFKNLGLITIDEQHKFGVFQREFLTQKSGKAHLLVMTATPIPRTLALMLYGELDLSVISETPKGRGGVRTLWMGEDKRGDVDALVREALGQGRQAYLVYPALDAKSDKLKSAVQSLEDVKLRYPGRAVGLIHGQMAAKDKAHVMRKLKSGGIQVLVATTVIEVGLDIANATMMVIENAERFGLSQMHQLRGRIGRGEHDSTCILMSDATHPETVDRLSAFTGLESGFDVAEKDLRLRGPGDLIGKRQSGVPSLRIGDLIQDAGILEKARDHAFRIIDKDNNLIHPENQLLRKELTRRFMKFQS